MTIEQTQLSQQYNPVGQPTAGNYYCPMPPSLPWQGGGQLPPVNCDVSGIAGQIQNALSAIVNKLLTAVLSIVDQVLSQLGLGNGGAAGTSATNLSASNYVSQPQGNGGAGKSTDSGLFGGVLSNLGKIFGGLFGGDSTSSTDNKSSDSSGGFFGGLLGKASGFLGNISGGFGSIFNGISSFFGF